MARSVVFELSKKFALRIIRLYVYLKDERKEYVMSKQYIDVEQVLGLILQKADLLKAMLIISVS